MVRAAKGALPGARLDGMDLHLIQALSRDGRRTAASLAKEFGLSRQAVTGRIRDLERKAVIRGYRADVNPGALGLEVRAHLHLTLNGSAPREPAKRVLRLLTGSPLVRSVFRVSGEDCFVAHVICRRIEDVNALLKELQATRAVQSSRTSFVLETLLERPGLGPVDGALLPSVSKAGKTP